MTAPSTTFRACALGDLTEGAALAVEIDGEPVALVLSGGEVFAIEDRCSHADVPLSEGDVEGCFIECWLHGSRFDLRSGEPDSLPATRPVPVFRVEVVGEGPDADVLVHLEP